MVVAPPAGWLVFATSVTRTTLSRQAQAGQALRLAAGAYAVGASLPPEAAARQHRLALIAHLWPDAVLTGKTALAGGEPVNGSVFISHPSPARNSSLQLPGTVVRVQLGPGRLPGDMSFPEGLWLSGTARGLVENVNLPGRPLRSRAGTQAVEDAIDELARTGGAGRVLNTLQQLDVIARHFDPRAVEAVRVRLAAVLGTRRAIGPISARLGARLSGHPFDQHRLSMLAALLGAAADRAPAPRAALGGSERWRWLPFYEAYFSNYIEGTKFGLDEARSVAMDGLVPRARPQDAHDVSATYRIVSDPAVASWVPRTADDLVDGLRERHAVLMAGRPDTHPGQFKEVPNYAGGYRFVDPELVEGTLRRGFAALNEAVDPFARAVAMMLLVTECHAFEDGNGRVARVFVNAELSVAGQVRIVIPTVYRDNYLAALSGVSNGAGRGESLLAVLDFAQRWTAAVDWRDYELARADVTASNGFVEPFQASAEGLRLLLPHTVPR